MKNSKNHNKYCAIIGLGFLAIVGTYNAIMINSGSTLSSSSFQKAPHESKGIIVPGRSLAATPEWKNLSQPNSIVKAQTFRTADSSSITAEATVDAASIQEALDLKLTEVMNPNWTKESLNKFSGTLTTNNGVIESLSASLSEGKAIDISFSEMTGNTFQYDYNGEVFTGMMYQVDMNAYMISLTNGPLEGTRMRFSGSSASPEAQAEETQQFLADNHKVEIGTFSEDSDAPEAETSAQAVPAENYRSSSYKF